MKQSEFSSLPIVVSASNRMGCFRVLHILIAIPLVGLATWALYWGDMSGLGVLAIAAAISGACELLGYWVNRDTVPSRYEIDAEEVCYWQGQERWREPLSAYESIDWLETHPVGEGMVDWRVELRHRDIPERSVILFENGLSGRNMDTDLTTWHHAREMLGLPGHRTVGSVFSQLEREPEPAIKNTAPLRTQTPDPDVTAILVRRSMLVWIVLPFVFFGGTVLLYQQIADRGFGRLLSENGTLLLLTVLGFALIVGWALTTVRVSLNRREIEIKTWVGPFAIRTRYVASQHLRDVSAIFNNFGTASVSLHRDGHKPVWISNIRSGDARRLEQFLENVTNDVQHETENNADAKTRH